MRNNIINDKTKPKTILIKKVLWYVSTIIGILLIAFGVIRYFVNKGIEENVSAERIETIVETQLILKIQNDSLLENIKEMKVLLNENIKTVEGLSNSYVLFMENNKLVTKDDLRNYMEGVTWEEKKKQ
jgi:hypothetical protein